jgi:heme/copper-type cytochrome/quinol oxidase subunit 2
MTNITLGMVVVVVMDMMMIMMVMMMMRRRRRKRKTLCSPYMHMNKVRLISLKTI